MTASLASTGLIPPITTPQAALRPLLMSILAHHIEDRLKSIQKSAEFSALLEILKQRSYREGDFVLSSGMRSKYYIDARTTTLYAKAAPKVGKLLWQLIEPLSIEAVGGLTLGADPVVSAVIYASALNPPANGKCPDGFLIRKQPKSHGTQKRIEGLPKEQQPPKKVVLLEDVTTTGGSFEEAYQAVKLEWPETEILACISIIDRREGALANQPTVTSGHFPFISLYQLNHFDKSLG